MNISTNFDRNISHFHEILDISKNFDIVYRTLTIAGKNACLYFVADAGLRIRKAGFFSGIRP